MFPKEHGAYGQMAMPLVTAFAIGGTSLAGALLALAVLSAFVAHEPLLVLLGRRGARVRRESQGRAARWLAGTAGLAAVTGLASVSSMPPDARWTLAFPLVPAAVLAVAIAAGREKSTLAEAAVALAFSFVALPVCLAAGLPVSTGATVAVVFAAVFLTGTLAVRRIIVAVRGGGDPRAARILRVLVLTLSVGLVIGFAAAGSRGLLPWHALLAAVPGLGVASWLALFPPPPSRLRTVGWSLVTSSGAAVLILSAGLAGVR